MPTAPQQPASWWMDGHGWVTAQALLDGLESGRWTLATKVRSRKQGPARELRHWLREIVLSSFDPHGREHADDVYRLAFERAHVGLAASDVRGQLVAVNDAFASLLGYEAKELIGAWAGELSGPDPEDRELKLGNDMMAGRVAGYTIEKTLKHRDGTLIPVLVTMGLARSDDGAPTKAVASILDLRSRQAEEERERVEQSLKATQLVARGVAHDVSNLLTAIQASAEGLREDHVELADNEDIDTIDLASEALARLVSQLKRLALSGRGAPARCDLVHELQTRLPLLGRLLGAQQRLQLDLPAGAIPIRIDASGLEQLVLNLVVNASQAMEDREGTVTIVVRAHEETVELAVEDEGVGMSEEVRRRAMEPFFTTKADGSGLGLAIVNAVLVRASATLQIDPGPKRGTVMRVLFPRVGVDAAAGHAPADSDEASRATCPSG